MPGSHGFVVDCKKNNTVVVKVIKLFAAEEKKPLVEKFAATLVSAFYEAKKLNKLTYH